jgi:hypothetical protein
MSDEPRRGPGRPKAPPDYQLCLRVPQPMYDALKRVADRNEASVSAVVRTILSKRSPPSD